MKKSFYCDKKGFSFFEMLFVFFIIGLVSLIFLKTYFTTLQRARDARRIGDMATLQGALELYYDHYGKYPDAKDYGENETQCAGWDTSGFDNDNDGYFFLEPLIDEGFVTSTPLDPINSESCIKDIYKYKKYKKGSHGCPSGRGDFYVMGITNLDLPEKSSNNTYKFRCADKNWNNEFDWVVGRYEN